MKPIPLMREKLRPLHEALREEDNPHPGIRLQRGLQKSEAKAEYISGVCKAKVDDFYPRAFQRWKHATSDKLRFQSVILDLESRLFIGLTGGGMLETGCAISHSYGTPYIPGSSIKGVVRTHARGRFETAEGDAICDELFGAPATGDHPIGLSGLITFHDAWWVPDLANKPLVQEVVTTHHLNYYGQEGAEPATDFDSPVPNAQVAVRGAFLFVMEGPCAWLGLAKEILVEALHTRGIGAKTRTGYGRFKPNARCQWVDDSISKIAADNHASELETLRGKLLAEAWAKTEEPIKREAFLDIRARWQEQGWWETPPGKARRIKAIYDEYSKTMD